MATNSPYANYTHASRRRAATFATRSRPRRSSSRRRRRTSASCGCRSAFIEMSLGENFCNGIPLGNNANGVVDYSSPDVQAAHEHRGVRRRDQRTSTARSTLHRQRDGRERDLRAAGGAHSQGANARRQGTVRRGGRARAGERRADDLSVSVHDVDREHDRRQRDLDAQQLRRRASRSATASMTYQGKTFPSPTRFRSSRSTTRACRS